MVRLKRACGVGDTSISTFFCQAMGVTQRRYVEERRLATAAAVLRRSRLPVWQVGELLGFRNARSFGRAFRRGVGIGPSEVRMTAA